MRCRPEHAMFCGIERDIPLLRYIPLPASQTIAPSFPIRRGAQTASKVKVEACRPEGSPYRAQANEMQDFTRSTSVQRKKKTQHPVPTASNDHTQQPPQSSCHRLSRWNIFAALSPKCRQVFLVSVVLWCSIQESCESNVPRARLQHKKRTSILPGRMSQTKVSIQRSPTAPVLCCSTHINTWNIYLFQNMYSSPSPRTLTSAPLRRPSTFDFRPSRSFKGRRRRRTTYPK